ncbi:MAG: 4Fe-4S dicluster domain-containing protein [Burkholderiaceae bacterium]
MSDYVNKKKEIRHLLCSCGGTMDIESKVISKALGYDKPLPIFSSLCSEEQQEVMSCLEENEGQVIIACTQFQSLFSSIADELEKPEPLTVNIRERAGWSKDSKSSSKIAALILQASNEAPPIKTVPIQSDGRCLIYGGGEKGWELAKSLSETLGVTLMYPPNESDITPQGFEFGVIRGKIKTASGHFGKFTLTIDEFSEMLPFSRDKAIFGSKSNDVETDCDIIIDLSKETPLFSSWQKRDGYFRGDPSDVLGLEKIKSDASDMIGLFEKPLYVNFEENLCGHSRNGQTGCTRCLDVCPASAISSNNDVVYIDQGICGGCGMCGAVCPSGAAQTNYPTISDELTIIDALKRNYTMAGGKNPWLLLHDGNYGNDLIDALARFDIGLPANLIPYQLHSVGRVGHDILISALSFGFEKVFIFIDPNKFEENKSIINQIELANSLIEGVGISSEKRFVLVQEEDPEKISKIIWEGKSLKNFVPSPITPLGSPRAITRAAMKALAKANNSDKQQISLNDGAPYGRVEIDTDNCTICLSCVGACPAGALQDNPDAPQLLFREDACIQCGICKVTCPEKVIQLVPQFNLADDAMKTELIIQDEPFHCKSCGKAFGTTKSIEAVIDRLSEHSMFQQSGKIEMLKLCEDCRVDAIFSQEDKLVDVGERNIPRTTDDYKN